MTNEEAIKWLREAEILDLASGNTKDREAVNMAISALQAQDSSVELFPDLTIVEKAEIRGYVKGQLDAINDLVAAGLIERGKAFSILKDHDLDEMDGDTISRQAAIEAIYDRYYKYGRTAKVEELVWTIEKLPSAQPERKRGRWIVHYECPKCGEITKDFTEYCPFCNADMRGEQNE